VEKLKQQLKNRIIGFFVGFFVASGFTILGLKIDIKIISMYDHNPYGSFMLYLLVVGLIIGWIVESKVTRRLIGELEKNLERVG
jgi:hypothetical protein